MKILFANPPTYEHQSSFFRPVRFPTYNYATPVMHPPIYLAYAAAYIREKGHTISFIDAPVLGMSVSDFIQAAKGFCPDIIVFETSTPSFTNDCRVISDLRAQWPSTPLKVVFLGTHVTALPHESLQAPMIDAIILGEFECSLLEYIEKGPVHTQGVGYRSHDGKIIINEKRPYCTDIDSFPMPARDLIPNYKYFDPILKNPFTFIISGRGCPYPCTFCNWPEHLTGRTVRKRSPQRIVDEIEHITKNYTIKSFLFNDDTFTADKEHAAEIANELIKRRIRIPWGCYARADFQDTRILALLKKAGCFLLKVGIESADETILKNCKKNYDLSRVHLAIKGMLSLGFHVHGTFAFGLPGETESTIKKTIDFACTLNPTTVQFSIAVPYPGTEFYRYLKTNNYLVSHRWDEYMPLQKVYEYPHLSFETMKASLKRAYRAYYMRPRYFAIGLRQCISQPSVFFGNARKLIRLITSHDNT